MNYERTASEVLKHIGGKENIAHFEHCSTRLRFSLKDDKKADVPTLERIEGVMAVKMGSQCQVVIGNDVIEVYDEVVKLLGPRFAGDEEAAPDTKKTTEKKKWGAVFLDFLTGVFGPLVPAIAGGGVLKSLLLLLSVLGWMNPDGQTYKILFQVGDAPLYFLPLLVAITTANKLKVNSLVALSAVGAMLLPKMSTLLTDGAELIGFSVRNISYSYQVFPAILTVLLYAQLEKGFTKISPKVIRVFFVPMMSLLITVPTSLLLLGPIGYTLGEGFTKVILFVFSTVGWVAVALLAALLPLIVSIGMHKALIPYVINALGTSGKELLYNPASLAHNISESGACFAVAIRTKDKRLRATAISAGISALFGITEPALYGVTLQHKKVLWSVMSGAFVGGAFVGIVGLQSFVAVGPGLASLSMFVSAELPRNIVNAIIGLLIAFVVAFVVALTLFKDKAVEALEQSAEEKSTVPVESEREQRKLAGTLQASETFKSPAIGEQIPLSQVNDEVFSTKAMGEGIAIVPSVGELYAPVDGKIEMVFGKKHAIAMSTAGGAELLFHVGIDTVRLKGKHFDPQVQAGDLVKAGDLLMKFDPEQIAAEGYDPVVLTIVTSKDKYAVDVANLKKVGRHDTLMTVTALTH